MHNSTMSRVAPNIDLTPEERLTLGSWARTGKTEQRTAFRAKIILAASEGTENKVVAANLRTTVATVGKWRHRFATNRLNGLSDAPRPGIASVYDDEDIEKRVLEMLDATVGVLVPILNSSPKLLPLLGYIWIPLTMLSYYR